MAIGAPDPRQLEYMFQFTTEQLAANRAGTIAPGQLTETIKAAVFGSLFVLAILGFGFVATRGERGVPALRIIAPLLMAIGGAGIAAIAVVPAVRDLITGTVSAIDGKVDSVGISGKGRGDAVLVVGNVRILTRADPSAARSLVEKDVGFRVYYLPYSKRLLSLERAQVP